MSYHSRKAAKDAAAIERMKELSAQYPRYGYRRIRIFLGRDGQRMSAGRAYRLWSAAGLQLQTGMPCITFAHSESDLRCPVRSAECRKNSTERS